MISVVADSSDSLSLRCSLFVQPGSLLVKYQKPLRVRTREKAIAASQTTLRNTSFCRILAVSEIVIGTVAKRRQPTNRLVFSTGR